MSNDITIGNAFHKVGEVAHINEYCTKDNKPIEDDIKTRIAYIIDSTLVMNLQELNSLYN